jgi:hypothetical protein
MNRLWLIFIFVVLVLTPTFVFGQTDENEEMEKARRAEAEAAAQQQLEAQKQQEEIAKSQSALRDFLNDQNTNRRITPGAQAALEARFLEFRLAIPKFREATDDYRWNLSLKDKLDKPLKNIEAQTDVLLRYLSAAGVKHPRPDPGEFKDYSSSELEWETLNTAERIGSFLDLAVAVERKNVVATQTLEFLYTLDGDLLRLKWLVTHSR